LSVGFFSFLSLLDRSCRAYHKNEPGCPWSGAGRISTTSASNAPLTAERASPHLWHRFVECSLIGTFFPQEQHRTTGETVLALTAMLIPRYAALMPTMTSERHIRPAHQLPLSPVPTKDLLAAMARVTEGLTWLRLRDRWFVRGELSARYLVRVYRVRPELITRVERGTNLSRLLAQALPNK
jgi:hypothetical protein